MYRAEQLSLVHAQEKDVRCFLQTPPRYISTWVRGRCNSGCLPSLHKAAFRGYRAEQFCLCGSGPSPLCAWRGRPSGQVSPRERGHPKKEVTGGPLLLYKTLYEAVPFRAHHEGRDGECHKATETRGRSSPAASVTRVAGALRSGASAAALFRHVAPGSCSGPFSPAASPPRC